MDGYTVISEPTITVVNGNFYTVDQNVYNFYDPKFTYPAGSYIEYKGKLYQYETESKGIEPTSATLVQPFDNVNVNASIDDVKEILAGEGGVEGSFLTQSAADAKYATIATVNTKLDTTTYTADKATFALKSEIPDVSDFATTEQVNAKLDTTVYEADKETFALKSDITSVYRFKGSVATADALPEDAEVGDVYNVESDGNNYAYTGTSWDSLGATIDLTQFYTKTEVDSKLDEKQPTGDYVEYKTFRTENHDADRKTIQLANHDSISGVGTNGQGYNIAMVSKWDKVDLGTASLTMNLNSKDGVVQLNDEKVIATTDQIPDVSGFATTEQVNTKLDTVTYTSDKATFALKTEIPDITGKLDTTTYTADKATFALKSEIPDISGKLDTTVYEADKETFALKSELPNCIRINIRDSKLTTEVHSKEDILGWFKCTTEVELKKKISSETQMFLLYGISLSTNPMYYRMPIEYIAFESATQIKMVFSGLNTHDDVVSKYVIIMNLDGTVIGDSTSNVSMTITSLENTSKVTELESKNTELETKITELEQRLSALEGNSETV